MAQWYIRVSEQLNLGPLENDAVVEEIERGQIKPDTELRHGQEGIWAPPGTFSRLQPHFPPAIAGGLSRSVGTTKSPLSRAAHQPEPSTGLIGSLWRGEQSLAKTYWVFGVLGGLLFRVIFEVLDRNVIHISATTGGKAVYLLALLLLFVYFIIVYVGIWRSAGRYEGSGVWTVLARVIVVLGTLSLAYTATKVHENLTLERLDSSKLAELEVVLNKGLPAQIDEVTRLDRVKAGVRTFRYEYTLLQEPTAEFGRLIEQHLLAAGCAEPDLKPFFAGGVTVIYSYRTMAGKSVAEIPLTPVDCGY